MQIRKKRKKRKTRKYSTNKQSKKQRNKAHIKRKTIKKRKRPNKGGSALFEGVRTWFETMCYPVNKQDKVNSTINGSLSHTNNDSAIHEPEEYVLFIFTHGELVSPNDSISSTQHVILHDLKSKMDSDLGDLYSLDEKIKSVRFCSPVVLEKNILDKDYVTYYMTYAIKKLLSKNTENSMIHRASDVCELYNNINHRLNQRNQLNLNTEDSLRPVNWTVQNMTLQCEDAEDKENVKRTALLYNKKFVIIGGDVKTSFGIKLSENFFNTILYGKLSDIMKTHGNYSIGSLLYENKLHLLTPTDKSIYRTDEDDPIWTRKDDNCIRNSGGCSDYYWSTTLSRILDHIAKQNKDDFINFCIFDHSCGGYGEDIPKRLLRKEKRNDAAIQEHAAIQEQVSKKRKFTFSST